MKICILHIGQSAPNKASQSVPAPVRFINALKTRLTDVQWTVVSAVNEKLPDITAFDGYIITGGKYSVFDQISWQNNLFYFLQAIIEEQLPLIGICYGHQAIAKVMGGKVARSPKGYGVGLMPVNVIKTTSWCTANTTPLLLHAMHQDQVMEMPSGAELFLRGDFCPISGYFIKNKVLGIQQHPDFNSLLNKSLIQKRHDLIGSVTVREGIKSLSGPDHTETSINWMVDFLLHATN
jgi:GMP synthase-like glutamine amidotransferase